MRLDPHEQNGAPSLWPVSASGRTLLIGPASEEAVWTGLHAPYCGFFECEAAPPREEIEALLRDAVQGGELILSLSTRSAWQLDLTGLITAAVCHHWEQPTPLEHRRELERQISEAITHALVHDNLGLDAAPHDSLSDLLSYLDQVEIRLRDPEIASRRLDLRILPHGSSQLRLVNGDTVPSRRPSSLFRRLTGAIGRRLPQLPSLPPPFPIG